MFIQLYTLYRIRFHYRVNRLNEKNKINQKIKVSSKEDELIIDCVAFVGSDINILRSF